MANKYELPTISLTLSIGRFVSRHSLTPLFFTGNISSLREGFSDYEFLRTLLLAGRRSLCFEDQAPTAYCMSCFGATKR